MRNELISTLQEMDTTYWSGQQGGIAPIPQYAMAIAQAVSTNNGTAYAAMPIVLVPGGGGGGGGGRNKY